MGRAACEEKLAGTFVSRVIRVFGILAGDVIGLMTLPTNSSFTRTFRVGVRNNFENQQEPSSVGVVIRDADGNAHVSVLD